MRKYFEELRDKLEELDSQDLIKVAKALSKADRVFVAGNGGSAAIANHLCCDISKGCRPERFINTFSLVANSPMLTAISNDLGYQYTLSYQLDLNLQSTRDVVFLISSSGNSPNIVEAAKLAKSRKHLVIGFTGFTGGKLKRLADLNIHVNSANYGVIEDTHMAAIHAISQYIKRSAYTPR